MWRDSEVTAVEYQDYLVAACRFRVEGTALMQAVAALRSFDPFLVQSESDPDFRIVASEEVPAIVKRLYEFDADGVDSAFCTTAEGYLLEMLRPSDGAALSLWCRKGEPLVCVHGSYAAQLLRFALWMGYGLMTVYSGRIAVHSSCIVQGGRAYLFLGESGTGKSTHTRLWREHVPGSKLLNDDSPVLAAEEDGIYVYGSPWSGKTPCYLQKKFPLGGCVRLSQAPYNRMVKLSRLQSFAAVHPSCPPSFAYDEYLYSGILKTLDRLLPQVPFYHLECLPDSEAALLSYQTLSE